MLSLFLGCLAFGILWALWLLPRGQVRPDYAGWMAMTAFALLVCRLAAAWDAWTAWAALGILLYRLRPSPMILAPASLLGALALGRTAWVLPGQKALILPTVGLSALVLGTTLDAMILGHWYLVQHGLSFEPLKRMSLAVMAVVGVRLALAGFWVVSSGSLDLLLGPEYLVFFLMRGVLGFLGPLGLGWMVWECVKLKSNTSATGILYVITVFVLVGEFSAAWFWTSAGAWI